VAAPLPAISSGPLAAGPVAQWLEPAAHNGLVAGSSPAGPTNEIKYLTEQPFLRRTVSRTASILLLLAESVLARRSSSVSSLFPRHGQRL
jgi:hypothetical protein